MKFAIFAKISVKYFKRLVAKLNDRRDFCKQTMNLKLVLHSNLRQKIQFNEDINMSSFSSEHPFYDVIKSPDREMP